MGAADLLRMLSVGHVTHDRYGEEIVPGGCAFYAARTWKALGARVSLATCVGVDFAGDEQLEDIRLFRDTGGLTTVFTNTYGADGALQQRVEHTASRVEVSVLEPPPGRFDGCFLGPVISEVDLGSWLGAVDAHVIGAGMQGFFRGPGLVADSHGSGRPVVPTRWRPAPEDLSRLGAVFMSEEDLSWYGDDGFLDHLRSRVRWVFVTDGDRGCTVFSDGETHRVGVYSTVCVDPTGAGDTFAAATILGLVEGCSPVEAARLGAAAASVVVEGVGGEKLSMVVGARERSQGVPVLES